MPFISSVEHVTKLFVNWPQRRWILACDKTVNKHLLLTVHQFIDKPLRDVLYRKAAALFATLGLQCSVDWTGTLICQATTHGALLPLGQIHYNRQFSTYHAVQYCTPMEGKNPCTKSLFPIEYHDWEVKNFVQLQSACHLYLKLQIMPKCTVSTISLATSKKRSSRK